MPDRLDARCVGGYTLSIYRDGTARFNVPAVEIARLTPDTVAGVKVYLNDEVPGTERIGFTLHDHVPDGGLKAANGRFNINPILRDVLAVDTSVLDGPVHVPVGTDGMVLSVLIGDLADAFDVEYDPDVSVTLTPADGVSQWGGV